MAFLSFRWQHEQQAFSGREHGPQPVGGIPCEHLFRRRNRNPLAFEKEAFGRQPYGVLGRKRHGRPPPDHVFERLADRPRMGRVGHRAGFARLQDICTGRRLCEQLIDLALVERRLALFEQGIHRFGKCRGLIVPAAMEYLERSVFALLFPAFEKPPHQFRAGFQFFERCGFVVAGFPAADPSVQFGNNVPRVRTSPVQVVVDDLSPPWPSGSGETCQRERKGVG